MNERGLFPDRRKRRRELDDTGWSVGSLKGLRRAAKGGDDQAIVRVLAQEFGIDVLKALNDLTGEARDSYGFPEIHRALGAEALGCYLPWHFFGRLRNPKWGIYLFLDNLLFWSADVWLRFHHLTTPPLSKIATFRLAVLGTYRHELFHYHVEAMYGPPPDCKRFDVGEETVCENVSGL